MSCRPQPVTDLCFLLRRLDRVQRPRRTRLRQGISISLAIVRVGLLLNPLVHINRVIDRRKDRETVLAFRTENVIPLDGGHGLTFPSQMKLNQAADSGQINTPGQVVAQTPDPLHKQTGNLAAQGDAVNRKRAAAYGEFDVSANRGSR